MIPATEQWYILEWPSCEFDQKKKLCIQFKAILAMAHNYALTVLQVTIADDHTSSLLEQNPSTIKTTTKEKDIIKHCTKNVVMQQWNTQQHKRLFFDTKLEYQKCE